MSANARPAGCLACDLTAGLQPQPGGRVYATGHWVVEHCVGSLVLDTLIVNPFHHCARIWELTGEESQGLGPLLRLTSLSIRTLLAPDQIYPCQWSHAGWEPGHLHFVLQPAWDSDRNHYERPGPFMQDAMFEANEMPAAGDVEAFAEGARQTFRRLAASVADVA